MKHKFYKLYKNYNLYFRFPFFLFSFLVLLGTSIVVYTNFFQKAVAAWADDNFGYRQTVTITNSGSAQTDYQVSFTLDTATLITAGKMLSNCNDLRVTDYNGNLLPYWVEESGTNACNTATTKIWVKIPSLIAGTSSLLVYYGNPMAKSQSSGSAVFEFFDNFSLLDTSKWTVTGSPTLSSGILTLPSSTLSSVSTYSNQTVGFRAKTNSVLPTSSARLGFNQADVLIGPEEQYVKDTVLSSNLVSLHKLEETTTTDANQFKPSGYYDTGKLSQAVSVYGNAAGTTGSTLTFNRGAQISGNNYEHMNANQGTVSFWFKPSWDGNDSVAHYLFDSGTTPNMTIYYQSSYMYAKIGTGNLRDRVYVSGVITSGNWYHVNARWDADAFVNGSQYITIFINNSHLTGSDGGDVTWTAQAPANKIFIGSNSSSTQQAQALIDDFAIFDRVLTTTEIADIYNSGTGKEAGTYADPSLKFYAKLDGSGTLSPVTYNAGANVDETAYNSSTNANGEVMANGNFEAASGGAPTSWTTVSSTTADAEAASILSDTRSQKLTVTGASQGIKQALTVVAAENYVLEGWLKSDGTNTAQIRVRDATNSTDLATLTSTANTYAKVTTAFKVPAGCTSIEIYVESGTAASYSFYADSVSVHKNLVDNGGMEGGANPPSGQTAIGAATVTSEGTSGYYHSGTYSEKVVTTAAGGSSQNISITAGNWYLASVWLRISSGTQVEVRDGAAPISGSSQYITGAANGDTWKKYSWIFQAVSTDTIYQMYINSFGGAATFYVDDVSVVALDNVATSFQSWTPVTDSGNSNADPLSIHGDSNGVTSNASGQIGNAYTFDGSTGYLRQKTYAVNIGTLSYGTNQITDSGQTFTTYKSSNPAAYMIVVTNSDNTTSWGYIGSTGTATQADIFTTKTLATAGWNGTSPTGKTPVGYEIRKTDYQITGAMTVGAWVKTAGSPNILSKNGTSNSGSYRFVTYDTTTNRIAFGKWGAVKYGGTTISDNVWHFVAASYDGSGTFAGINLYVDGNLETGTTVGSFSALADSYEPITIGADFYSTGNAKINGSIDSPFVLNTALTQEQVTSLYNSTAKFYLATTDGSNTYGINSATSIDTNYHNYEITQTASNSTMSVDGGTATTSGTNYPTTAQTVTLTNADTSNTVNVDWVYVRKNVTSPPSLSAPAGEEKGGAPVAYWKFDDGTGTNAQDSSSNNNDGTITGATWQTEDMCVSGRCLKFNGSGNNVNSGDNASVKLTTSGTVEAWIKPITYTHASGWQVILNKGNFETGRNEYGIYYENSTSTLKGIVAGSSGNRVVSVANTITPLSSWSHVVLTWDTTANSVKLYVNGVQKDSQTANGTPDTSGASFLMGSYVSNYHYSGFLDDVKLFNYARSAAQVKADYNARGVSKGSSVSSSTNQAGAGGLSNGLIAWWKMDEASGTLADSSGNNNTGTWNGTGASHYTAGKFGNGGGFNGTDDYVSVTDTAILRPGTSSYTLSVWFKRAAGIATAEYLLAKPGDSGSSSYDLFITNAGGTIRLRTGLQTINSAGGTFADGNWHLATAVVNRQGNGQIYVDGMPSGTPVSLIGTSDNLNNTANLWFGNRPLPNNTLNGSLDEVRIYNRALSPAEVRQLYNYAPGPVGYWDFEDGSGGSVTDKSGNSNTGTWSGTGNHWTTGKFGKAGGFNGSDDYVNLGTNLDQNGELTISAWFNTRTVQASSYGDTIIGNGTVFGNTSDYLFVVNRTAGKLSILWDNSVILTSNTTITANTWYHATMIRSGSTGNWTVKIYLNGNLDSSTTTVTNPDGASAATAIGRFGALSNLYFNGSIDDVKIYNYARTPDQIMEDMYGRTDAGVSLQGVTASGKGTVINLKMDEGTGNPKDSSGNNKNGTLNDGASWSQSGKYGKGINLDGSNDDVSVADFSY